MQSVYLATDITEAEIVRGLLQSEGIESHVSGFYLQGAVGELAASDTARVMVNDHDVDRARTVIRDYDPKAMLAGQNDDQGRSSGQTVLIALLVLLLIGLVSYLLG